MNIHEAAKAIELQVDAIMANCAYRGMEGCGTIEQIHRCLHMLGDVHAKNPPAHQAWQQYVQTKKDLINLSTAQARLTELESPPVEEPSEG